MAAPIVVEGGLWGANAVGTLRDEPLSRGTEARLGQFTELMATAIASIESGAEVERLAEEQVALRGVATLVAAGGAPDAAAVRRVAEGRPSGAPLCASDG